jgi:acetyltransferase-like isoleucine patch superfamily enzyme
MNNGFRQAWAKYDFPLHLFVVWDRLVGALSTAYSTLRLKLQLRCCGCAFGAGLAADGPVVIRLMRRGSLQLGRNVHFKSRRGSNLVGLTNPVTLQCLGAGRIRIGDNSGASGAVLSARSLIDIGANVNLGGGVRIYDHDYHSRDWRDRRDPARDQSNISTAPVIIEDDVFIGTQAILLKGVHVGRGSVIGAGSVVTLREIPPYSLVAGNPARVLRSLR